MKRIKILWILPILLLVIVGGFVLWAETAPAANADAQNALVSGTDVTVSVQNGWYVFTPTGVTPDTGFIFYPGGRVDEKAYALALREIAAQGYLVVLVPMPLNLAVFDPAAAADVIAAFPEIQHWAAGGHSLGGAMAANYAAANPGRLVGLVLWASYPAGSDDLTQSGLKVVSIYGSEDGLATGDKIDKSRALLPADTTWVKIQGGNHAQFGSYGAQAGDNPATISAEEQRGQVVEATVKLLETIQ
jgi:hypothetical protein